MYTPKNLQRMAFRYSEECRGLGIYELLRYVHPIEFPGDDETVKAIVESNTRIDESLRNNESWALVILSCIPSMYTRGLPDNQYPTPYQQGKRLYALLRRSKLEELGGAEAISTGLQRVYDGAHQLKHPMDPRGPWCSWHDVDHDIFFAPNAAFLKLIYSVLKRPADFSKTHDRELRFGDVVKLAVIINGRSCKSVFGMKLSEGLVSGLLSNQVTIKTHTKEYRMPYAYIITEEIKVENEHMRPRLEQSI